MISRRVLSLLLVCTFIFLCEIPHARGDDSIRGKIGQMIMVTVTGDSVKESSASMDTLKTDLSQGSVGGVILFTWSDNLNSPGQIAHLTSELQRRATIPLLLAIDEEGGKVARLGASNGFQATPSAYQLGTVVNRESYTRSNAAMMAGWFVQTGLNMNLAPVVDVNVNPTSPAIGALGRSFSARPDSVTLHASWFIDEFHKRNVLTTLKHFPGHGSAKSDSHLGFTDVTATWSGIELEPYRNLITLRAVDAVMTAHVFNAALDSVYPATLSQATITGILRSQLGYDGVVVSDEMSMQAITSSFGLDEAAVLAVNAGVDILLYNRNLDSTGASLPRRLVNLLENKVKEGSISPGRIEQSYARIMTLKRRILSTVAEPLAGDADPGGELTNYPNPFNTTTRIVYRVPTHSLITLKVYDLLGREVATLVNEWKMPGVHVESFDARTLASGVYVYRIADGLRTATRMMLLVR